MRLFDPVLIDDPYPFYTKWRDETPIWWDEDSRGWVLTRHEDVRAVLKNSAEYSSRAMGQERPLPLLSDDAPRHTQLRRIVDKAFTARTLRNMEADVARIATQLVQGIEPGTPVDIVQRLTQPLPVAVIAQMMGIPVERADDFKRWSDALTGTVGNATAESRGRDISAMAAYFHSLIQVKRDHPEDDLVSAVVNAEVDGKHLSDQDIVGFNMLLLIAGNETTTNLLTNLLNILVDRPQVLAQLVRDTCLIDAAVEETLRFDSPVQLLRRLVLVPATYHGHSVAAGDVVHVLTGAANRDERVYTNADKFELDRPRINHHSFGFGVHFCIGAPLARVEARFAIQALLKRFSRLERAPGSNERTASHMLRGFHHLWLQFDR